VRALVLLLLFASVARAATPAAPRVGVAPPRVELEDDAPPGELDPIVLADAVARGLQAAALEVTTATEVRAIAARAARSGLVCDARDASCAARLAAFSGLDFIVVTHASDQEAGPGRDHVVVLRLIDGRDGGTLRERQAPLADVVPGVEAVATALGLDAPVPGRLDVRGPPGVAIDVDGVVRGTAPLTLDVGAGLHRVDGRTVRVPAAGVAVVEAGDALDADVTTGLAIALGVGLSVAVGAGIGAFVIAPDRRDAYTARAWNDAVATGQALVAAAAVGGAVAALAGGLWATSTWLDDRETP
jgi:hypothetical protein